MINSNCYCEKHDKMDADKALRKEDQFTNGYIKGYNKALLDFERALEKLISEKVIEITDIDLIRKQFTI